MSAPRMCEAEWEYDVQFGVMCVLPAEHVGPHCGVADGNGGLVAAIRWQA